MKIRTFCLRPAHGGQPAAHGGQPVAHGGQPAAYAGQPTAHGGQPTADGGQPTAHGGQPTAHSGQPAAHCGQPTANGGQPTAHSGQPTAHGGQPTAHGGQPTVVSPRPTEAAHLSDDHREVCLHMHYLWKDHFRQDLFARAQGSAHGHPILACAPCDKLYTKAKMSTHVVQHESYVYHSLVCIAVKPTGLAQL